MKDDITYPTWLRVARKYIGEREIVGTKHNPLIIKMWQRLTLPFRDDETPWCAGFVGSCLEEAGIRSTRSGLALSYAKFGVPLPKPAVGAIAYMSRKNSVCKVIGGHVTFVVGQTKNCDLVCLGGKQNNKVGLDIYPRSRILGYRWPNGFRLPSAILPFVSVGTKSQATEA